MFGPLPVPRSSWWSACAFVVTAFGCRTPTEITIEIGTDFPCDAARGTAISVARVGALEGASAVTVTTTCRDARVGALVLVPSGDPGDEVAIRVVTGIRATAESCGPPDYAGCVVARRALHFVPHSELTVPITMRRSCLDRPCDDVSTCVEGRCVSSTIVDSHACAGAGCDEHLLSPLADAGPGDGGDGGGDVGDAADADAADAGSDAGGLDPFGDRRGLLSSAPWPMVNGATSQWSFTEIALPKTVGTHWTASTVGAFTANVVGPGGVAYFGVTAGYVAVDPKTHKTEWTAVGASYGDPALGADGNLYISVSGTLFAIDSVTGAELWRLPADASGDVSIGPGPIVFIGGLGLAVIDTTKRKQLWSIPSIFPGSPPSLAPSGKLYVGTNVGEVHEYEAASGKAGWTFKTGSGTFAPIIVGGDGAVYAATDAPVDTVFAIDVATGAERWHTKLDGAVRFGFGRGVDGTLYAATDHGTVYAIESTKGGVAWSHPGGPAFHAGLVIDRAKIIVASGDSAFVALDGNAKGAQLWSYPTTSLPVALAPASDGTLYLLSRDSLDVVSP